MKRAGFTLIEIMVVVGIIVVMLAGTMVSISSGRAAAHMREAARGVAQMTRYANALALLRQRPVILSYTPEVGENGQKSLRIDVRLSGESMAAAASGEPADPIYREVNGKDTAAAGADVAREEMREAAGEREEDKLAGEKAGLFFTRRVLEPDELTREDRSRVFENVVATVEMLGEDGAEVDEKTVRSLHDKAQGLLNNRTTAIKAWSNVRGEIDTSGKDDADEKKEAEKEPDHVLFATNGNCQPHRVTLRMVGEEGQDEGFVITVSRSGKLTVGDAEEK